MADQPNEFMRDYQKLAQQSWDAFARQLQQPAPAANPFFNTPMPPAASGSDTLERTLSGLKGYFDWMQGAAVSTGAIPGADWRQQLQQWLGGASQPFAQAFGGIEAAGAEGFASQWQSWLQAAQHSGWGDMSGTHGPVPGFGLSREQQMRQQALAAAMLEAMQASARYQALIQGANAQAVEKMQDKLAQHAEPGRQIESMKALYDLWVDASEESYAEIALSDEFQRAYGEMVNTQMRVRKMQQEQTQDMCQQLGLPTRAEVCSLGERLQALRREFRAGMAGAEVASLREEIAALKTALGSSHPAPSRPAKVAKPAPKPAPKPAARSRASAKAPRKTATRKVAKSAARATAKGRNHPSKRK